MLAPAALKDLRAALPAERLLTGEADLAAFSYDGILERSRPDAVFLARSAEEVAAAVRWCAARGVPFLSRGAGTNLSGGCVPLRGGLVISTALMTRVLSIDTRARLACVEPGVVNLNFQKALEPLGLFYAPDPASSKVCSLGGNVAENAGGPRCLKYGTTTHHVAALEVVLPDGSLERFGAEDAGPDLCALFTGSEGTLGTVTKIWARLLPLPETIHTLLAAFDSVEQAIACVSAIIAAGILPRTLEAMDRTTIDSVEDYLHCGYPRGAEAVLLIELDGAQEAVTREAEAVRALCRRHGAREVRDAEDAAERERLWEGRRGAYAALARLAPNVLVEDGVVPRDRLPEALRRVREICAARKARVALLFHAGDGNLHPNIIFDERDPDETARVTLAGREILQACLDLDGSLSGEHGIGSDKREAMAWLFTPATLALMRRVKRALDPQDLANPDKVIPLEKSVEGRPALRRRERPLSAAARVLAETVAARARAGEAFTVLGRGTVLSPFVQEKQPGGFVSTKTLNTLLELDTGNFTVRAEAGVPVEALRAEAAARGLHLALPYWRGTLGGLLACRPWPGLRDGVLGLRVLLSDGEIAEFGGKVVKNVAGYDLARLLLGSWGGYAIILDATLKAYAAAPAAPSRLPPARPFSPTSRHLALKKAFDPKGLLNPWLFAPASVT